MLRGFPCAIHLFLDFSRKTIGIKAIRVGTELLNILKKSLWLERPRLIRESNIRL